MPVLIPKYKYDPDPELPFFFLCGPVRGGGDWQRKCYEKFLQHYGHDKFNIAIPYFHCINEDFPLIKLASRGNGGEFERQLKWERHYIHHAAVVAKRGCLVFFLEEENKENPRKDGHYANDTLGEIARASTHASYIPNYRVVVGARPKFYSLDQIQRNWNEDQGKDYPFHKTLTETVAAAIQKAVLSR